MALSVTAPLKAEPLYAYHNISISALDWSDRTESETSHKDFSSIKYSGGLGYEWMDLYGYATIENPHHSYSGTSPNNQRYVGMVEMDFALKDQYKLYVKEYHFKGNDYFVNNFVVGLSTKYRNDSGGWIKPFVGVHFTNDSYFDGYNGFMGGWVFNYPFQLNDEKLSLSQWNEIEFGRVDSFYKDSNGQPMGDGKSFGLNGGLSLWWHMMDDVSSGIEYRYADHKLGNNTYQSSCIYTLKYDF